MDGVSLPLTFDERQGAAGAQRQYFEVFSNRAIYDNGWIARATHLPLASGLRPGHWDGRVGTLQPR